MIGPLTAATVPAIAAPLMDPTPRTSAIVPRGGETARRRIPADAPRAKTERRRKERNARRPGFFMGYSVMIRPDVDFQKQAVHNLGMTAEDLTEKVRSVVRKVSPHPIESIERDDLLGTDGLGFDS